MHMHPARMEGRALAQHDTGAPIMVYQYAAATSRHAVATSSSTFYLAPSADRPHPLQYPRKCLKDHVQVFCSQGSALRACRKNRGRRQTWRTLQQVRSCTTSCASWVLHCRPAQIDPAHFGLHAKVRSGAYKRRLVARPQDRTACDTRQECHTGVLSYFCVTPWHAAGCSPQQSPMRCIII